MSKVYPLLKSVKQTSNSGAGLRNGKNSQDKTGFRYDGDVVYIAAILLTLPLRLPRQAREDELSDEIYQKGRTVFI